MFDAQGTTDERQEAASDPDGNQGQPMPTLSTLPAAPGRHREPWPLLRSYVAPDDAARAFRLALELPGVPYDLFIITAADTFEPEPTLVHLERTYGTGLPVRKPEVYANAPRASAWDITRAREILGWSPSRNWDEFSAQF